MERNAGFLDDLAASRVADCSIFGLDVAARQQPAIQSAMVNQQDSLAVQGQHQARAGDVTGSEMGAGEWRWRELQQHEYEFETLETFAIGRVGKAAGDSSNAGRIDHNEKSPTFWIGLSL